MIFMRHSLLFQHFAILTQAEMIWHHLWMNLLVRQQFNRKSLYQKMCSVSLLIFTTPNLIWIWMNFDSDACDRNFRRFWLMWCDKEFIIATLNVWYILFENGINEYWGMDLVWNLIRKGNQISLSSFSFREKPIPKSKRFRKYCHLVKYQSWLRLCELFLEVKRSSLFDSQANVKPFRCNEAVRTQPKQWWKYIFLVYK